MLSVRKVEEADRTVLSYWVDRNAIVYQDSLGPVAGLLSTNVVRVDIQFFQENPSRNAAAVFDGFWPYCKVLAGRGIEEIICNSESEQMVHFLRKRFKFRAMGSTYSLRIK